MRHILYIPIYLVALAYCAAASSTYAQTADQPSPEAVQRAHDFLNSRVTGSYITGFVHLGSPYDSHQLVESGGVRGVSANGQPVPGEFALVYQFTWHGGTGKTTLAFLCDKKGNVEQIQALSSNAVLSPPFDLAKLSIAVLGETLLEAFKQQLDANDRMQIRAVVQNADPHALLEIGLKYRQAFNRHRLI
jgi:hypothetical protein